MSTSRRSDDTSLWAQTTLRKSRSPFDRLRKEQQRSHTPRRPLNQRAARRAQEKAEFLALFEKYNSGFTADRGSSPRLEGDSQTYARKRPQTGQTMMQQMPAGEPLEKSMECSLLESPVPRKQMQNTPRRRWSDEPPFFQVTAVRKSFEISPSPSNPQNLLPSSSIQHQFPHRPPWANASIPVSTQTPAEFPQSAEHAVASNTLREFPLAPSSRLTSEASILDSVFAESPPSTARNSSAVPNPELLHELRVIKEQQQHILRCLEESQMSVKAKFEGRQRVDLAIQTHKLVNSVEHSTQSDEVVRDTDVEDPVISDASSVESEKKEPVNQGEACSNCTPLMMLYKGTLPEASFQTESVSERQPVDTSLNQSVAPIFSQSTSAAVSPRPPLLSPLPPVLSSSTTTETNLVLRESSALYPHHRLKLDHLDVSLTGRNAVDEFYRLHQGYVEARAKRKQFHKLALEYNQ